MIRPIAVIVMLLSAWLSLLSAPASVGAQEPATDCASTFRLEAPAATPEPAAAQIQEKRPVWLTTELTDACSGEAFTLADFAGKTLFIEAMATWCGECYGQLTRVQAAAEDPGG